MKKFLLGILLILLGGVINTGSYMIELTPNFIGSFFLLLALSEFKIKDRNLTWSLWILTGIYLLNYIISAINPSIVPIQLHPILTGGSLLWGVYVSIKIVEKANFNYEESSRRNLNFICRWFNFLLVVSVCVTAGMIGILSTQGVINLICVWIYTIGSFMGAIARYALAYLFYKQVKLEKKTMI